MCKQSSKVIQMARQKCLTGGDRGVISGDERSEAIYYEMTYAGTINAVRGGWLCEDDQIFALRSNARHHQSEIMRKYLLEQGLGF